MAKKQGRSDAQAHAILDHELPHTSVATRASVASLFGTDAAVDLELQPPTVATLILTTP